MSMNLNVIKVGDTLTVDPERPLIEVKGGGRFLTDEADAEMVRSVPFQAVVDFLNSVGLNGTKGITRVVIDHQSVEVTVKAEDVFGYGYAAYSDAQPNLASGMATFTTRIPIDRS